jgi:glycosylphosphatidylinositol transamidase
VISRIAAHLPVIRILLFVVGYGWLLLLPWNGLSRRAWIDENALQPGQVNVEWSWADVKMADTELKMLEELWHGNKSSDQCVDSCSYEES